VAPKRRLLFAAPPHRFDDVRGRDEGEVGERLREIPDLAPPVLVITHEAAKQASESKRGAQNQSTEPARETSAAVRVLPIRQ
jgi:hypothetical protein